MENVHKLIELAIAEDMPRGDITSENIINENHLSIAFIKAKENLIICGLDVSLLVFEKIDSTLKVKKMKKDGDFVKSSEKVMSIEGLVVSILRAERIALNFLQRLSGISTNVSLFVKKLEGTGVKLWDTRKTTPGFRSLEKRAVICGGGENHRYSLSDQVMIKDNHIDAAGSIEKAFKKVKGKIDPKIKIEIETRNLEEVSEAVSLGPDIIMLDNMKTSQIQKAVDVIKNFEKKKILIEVSGGVNINNIRNFAIPGVDYISVGALTHSSYSSDLSLYWEKN